MIINSFQMWWEKCFNFPMWIEYLMGMEKNQYQTIRWPGDMFHAWCFCVDIGMAGAGSENHVIESIIYIEIQHYIYWTLFNSNDINLWNSQRERQYQIKDNRFTYDLWNSLRSEIYYNVSHKWFAYSHLSDNPQFHINK